MVELKRQRSRVIIGIDPGSLRTGFGIVADHGDKIVHVAHGTIVLDKTMILSDRLADLAIDLATIIKKYQPDHAAVEDVFLFKNPRSALVLGQARGAAIAVFGMNKIKTTTFAPTKIKALVSGRGRAQKFQVAQMVALQLGIIMPTSKDAADALAIALACAYERKLISCDENKNSPDEVGL